MEWNDLSIGRLSSSDNILSRKQVEYKKGLKVPQSALKAAVSTSVFCSEAFKIGFIRDYLRGKARRPGKIS